MPTKCTMRVDTCREFIIGIIIVVFTAGQGATIAKGERKPNAPAAAAAIIFLVWAASMAFATCDTCETVRCCCERVAALVVVGLRAEVGGWGWGLRFGVWAIRFGVSGLGFEVWGLPRFQPIHRAQQAPARGDRGRSGGGGGDAINEKTFLNEQ